MTLLHCLACDDLRAISAAAGPVVCGCQRSRAELSDDVVDVHGPCRVLWVSDPEVASTVAGSAGWPSLAPQVRRRPVPPLI